MPSRSTQVKRSRSSGGGSISLKPSSSQKATQVRTCAGRDFERDVLEHLIT